MPVWKFHFSQINVFLALLTWRNAATAQLRFPKQFLSMKLTARGSRDKNHYFKHKTKQLGLSLLPSPVNLPALRSELIPPGTQQHNVPSPRALGEPGTPRATSPSLQEGSEHHALTQSSAPIELLSSGRSSCFVLLPDSSQAFFFFPLSLPIGPKTCYKCRKAGWLYRFCHREVQSLFPTLSSNKQKTPQHYNSWFTETTT